MGITLIVIGLVIFAFSWATKHGYKYVELKSEAIVNKKKIVSLKIKNKEKLTVMEWVDWYGMRIIYGGLTVGIYLGLLQVFIGVIILLLQ